ncbi:nitrous oxide reductase accessory protein NosL [Cohnella nanjingensis]|uniref:Nitrous oxide reductase accessory protein NosL n=1 Tax=Cohnella nanjingensis TaxID=1387779 RepID=A0A7X0RTW1_9BACL|nr:nitrous oxide reductase accessory protein NosL [Cohnella nanjingensis]MBB6673602.1 nitrous oxide reductase accessory protein NosL [Cohnella nanjingensis]
MKKAFAWISLMMAAILLMAGCGQTKYEPVAIDEAVDKCPVCNMAVADDQYAVEIILKSKKALKFDDLGDLFVWRRDNGTQDIGEQFVRDYHTKEWVKLSEAAYVYDKTIRTPMAFNIISFKEKKDAENFIATEGKGQLLTAKDLDSRKWEPNEDMMKSMMAEHANEMKDMNGMDGKDMNGMDADGTGAKDDGGKKTGADSK